VLGLPGDYAAEPCHDCFATKVGGRPAPPPDAPPGALARRCRLCGGPTRLVLQAHAPLQGSKARQDRFLYVLCCAAPESPCALDPRGWVALRWLVPPSPSAGACPPTEELAKAPAQEAGAAGSWFEDAGGDWGAGGEEDDDWGGCGGGDDDLEEGARDLDALTGSLVAAMAGCRGPSTAAAPPLPREESPAVENPSEEAAAAPAGRAGGPFSPGDCLPEFYLYAEFEPSYSGASAADDPHIQALLRAYREEEAEPEQLSADGGGADAAAAAGGGGGWEGAQWEEDADADAQTEFFERLRRSPHQCVRYGGEPLWPRAAVPEFAACFCGAPRKPELVLCPGLLTALEEAGAEPQAPWVAVLIGTCVAPDCAPPGPAAAEEVVAVVAEL